MGGISRTRGDTQPTATKVQDRQALTFAGESTPMGSVSAYFARIASSCIQFARQAPRTGANTWSTCAKTGTLEVSSSAQRDYTTALRTWRIQSPIAMTSASVLAAGSCRNAASAASLRSRSSGMPRVDSDATLGGSQPRGEWYPVFSITLPISDSAPLLGFGPGNTSRCGMKTAIRRLRTHAVVQKTPPPHSCCVPCLPVR